MRPESGVLALARRQHGVASWEQLVVAGVSAGWVQHRLERGWLTRLHRGVYLVGPLETLYSRPMAATLATGPDAVVSHHPAAVLWGLRPPREGPIDVTIPGRKARSRPALRVHTSALHPRDVTRRHGIPVTSAARTILDLAATEPATETERALNEARILRVVSDPSLNEQFSRYPRHRGAANLKKLTQADTGYTRSRAERRLRELMRRSRLPQPHTNARVEGYEVDVLWREQRLVVEVDGYATHSMRRSFENDRRKDQTLIAAGYRVIRITWLQLTTEPEAVVAIITRALERR